jgi:hypothetical protein
MTFFAAELRFKRWRFLDSFPFDDPIERYLNQVAREKIPVKRVRTCLAPCGLQKVGYNVAIPDAGRRDGSSGQRWL